MVYTSNKSLEAMKKFVASSSVVYGHSDDGKLCIMNMNKTKRQIGPTESEKKVMAVRDLAKFAKKNGVKEIKMRKGPFDETLRSLDVWDRYRNTTPKYNDFENLYIDGVTFLPE